MQCFQLTRERSERRLSEGLSQCEVGDIFSGRAAGDFQVAHRRHLGYNGIYKLKQRNVGQVRSGILHPEKVTEALGRLIEAKGESTGTGEAGDSAEPVPKQQYGGRGAVPEAKEWLRVRHGAGGWRPTSMVVRAQGASR